MRHASFSLATQIQAAQRNAAGDAPHEVGQLSPHRKPTAPRLAPVTRMATADAVVFVLLAADKPLLAPEIAERMRELYGNAFSLALKPTLYHLVQRGAIRRFGLPGKYRYISN